MISIGPPSGSEDLVAPLAIDFSFLQNSNETFSVKDVWDGHSVNSEKVSKWVASKLKGIASYIGVAVSRFQGMRLRWFNFCQELKEIIVCLNKMWLERLRQLEDKENCFDLNSE